MTLGRKIYSGFLFSLPLLAFLCLVTTVNSMIATKKTMTNGIDTRAEIIRIKKNGEGRRALYSVALSWNDISGKSYADDLHFVSDHYWRQITRNDTQAEGYAVIRYRADDPAVAPAIVADYDDQLRERWHGVFVFGCATVVMLLCAFVLFRRDQTLRRMQEIDRAPAGTP